MDFTKLLKENLVEKLQADGFLLLVLPETAQKSIHLTFASAKQFFRESIDEKCKYSFPQDMGYRPFGIEYSQSPSFPDQVESFSVSARVPIPPHRFGTATARVLYEQMIKVFEILEFVAETLTIRIANQLSGTKMGNNIQGAFRNWSRLQLNYSQPSEVFVPFINESHEDGNLFTVACTNRSGLEVQITENKFIPITTSTNKIVILPGEIAFLLSGGLIPPTYHRVRPDKKINERMALLFFGDIDPKLCQPWISNEINREVDIGKRVISSVERFGLNGFSLDS
jgi:isopenicillin N synthase-like dioxygenase